MDKEKLYKIAGCLEDAGYRIVCLKERENPSSPDSWEIEIIPLNPFENKN